MELTKLKDPFPAEDIEWRVQSSGVKNSRPWALVLAYVTNRAIMDRLDAVCGPDNWQNKFTPAPIDGVLCGIAIRCEHGWVTKWDGADKTDIEAVKGGLSGAMKRAGSQWGIGRYLYNLPTGWANINEKGSHSDRVKVKDGQDVWIKWDPPELPAWALPGNETTKPEKKAPETYEDGLKSILKDVGHFSPPPKDKTTIQAISPVQARAMIGTLKSSGVSAEEFCEKFGIKAVSELPAAKNGDAIQWVLLEGKNRQ